VHVGEDLNAILDSVPLGRQGAAEEQEDALDLPTVNYAEPDDPDDVLDLPGTAAIVQNCAPAVEDRVGIETVLANFAPSAKRTEKLHGRIHRVVPMVMITAGVHNGSHGPLYYPEDELRRTAHLWNAIPVVVNHPPNGGSARQPHVLRRTQVGVVFNARFEDGKLKAEAWLEVEALRRVDARTLQKVDSGRPVEVSTGLFTENLETFGEEFDAVATDHRPDHLAILPDRRGACSIADGCGLMQNQAEDVLDLPPAWS